MPHIEKRRNPIASLMIPKTGSTVYWRSLYRARSALVATRWIIRSANGASAPGASGSLFFSSSATLRPCPSRFMAASNRLAVALARITQHRPEHPAPPGPLPIALVNRRAHPEVHLHLLARLAFHPLHPPGMLLLEPRREPLHRLVGPLYISPHRPPMYTPDSRAMRRCDHPCSCKLRIVFL